MKAQISFWHPSKERIYDFCLFVGNLESHQKACDAFEDLFDLLVRIAHYRNFNLWIANRAFHAMNILTEKS